jgi:molybdate transport system ATP-binding protein
MGLKANFIRRFTDSHSIEADFELDLDTSAITVLFGASGCGKTTILRCLAGLDHPDSGYIETSDGCWCNVDRKISLPAAQRRIGFVFQEATLFPHLSVGANIAFGLQSWPKQERIARVQELVALTGLEGLEKRRPRELSGGQKQRVALARSLAPKPQLLLLDEPFASLDGPAAEQLRVGLRQILQTMGVPAILVTHDREEALSLGDRLLLMQHGRIRQSGSPMEVFSKHPHWRLSRRLHRGESEHLSTVVH